MTGLSVNVMYICFGIFVKNIPLHSWKQLFKKTNIYSFYFLEAILNMSVVYSSECTAGQYQ